MKQRPALFFPSSFRFSLIFLATTASVIKDFSESCTSALAISSCIKFMYWIITENSLFVVPFERVCDITPAVNIFNNIGFKLRSSADDEDDESYLMSPVEFSKLDDKAKRCYDYYEYDSPSSWQYHFKDITERVLFIQEQINWMHDVYYRVKDLYLVCMGGF